MSWIVRSSPRLAIFDPLRRDLNVGDYISLENGHDIRTHDVYAQVKDNGTYQDEEDIGGGWTVGGGHVSGVWRIVGTDIDGLPNRYRAQVVSPGTNGIVMDFNIEGLDYKKLESYDEAMR